MLKECGCLPYYYPRLDAILQFQEGFENLTAACTLDGWKCLMSNEDILEAVDPMSHNTGDNVEVQKLTGAKYVSSDSLSSGSHFRIKEPNMQLTIHY